MRIRGLLFIAVLMTASCGGGGGGGPANRPPTVTIRADTTNGVAPLRVEFTADASDPDGDAFSLDWDTNGDGAADVRTGTVGNLKHFFTAPATVTVRVTDARGATASAPLLISVAPLPLPVTVVGGAGIGGATAMGPGQVPTIVANGAPGDYHFLPARDPLGSTWPQGTLIPFVGDVEVKLLLDRQGQGEPLVLGANDDDDTIVFARNPAADGSGTWSINPVTTPADGRAANPVGATVGEVPVVFCTLQRPAGAALAYLASFNSGAAWAGPFVVDEADETVFDIGGVVPLNDGVAVAYTKRTNDPGPPQQIAHELIVARIDDVADLTFELTTVSTASEIITHFTRIPNSATLAIVTLGPDTEFGVTDFTELQLYLDTTGTGAQWAAPLKVMESDLVLRDAALSLHDNLPAIVLVSALGGDDFELRSLHSFDSSATRWSESFLLDTLPGGFLFEPSGVFSFDEGLGISYAKLQASAITVNFLRLPRNEREQ